MIIHVTTPTIVKMANRMAAAGLLVRQRDDADHRLVRIHLTAAGRALIEPLAVSMQEIDSRLTAGLTGDEREQLMELMGRVIDNASGLLAEWDEPYA